MKLRFRNDGSFIIAQFTDLHFSDGNEADLKTASLMSEVLDAEKPDLAMLTGDVIAGVSEKRGDSACAWSLAVAPMEERGIPWAAALGNHDEEGSLDPKGLLAHQLSFAHCMSEPGPEEIKGEGNFVLEISSKHSGGSAGRLFVFDSHSKGPEGVGGYPWISHDQILWFRKRAAEAAQLPGLAFMHIPLPEYNDVWRTQACRGHKFEEVCCANLNSGLFTAMLESGAIQGLFSGHDHVNDYDGELHGIRLCYGRAGGFNSYGREGFPRGARIIRMREGQKTFESWLRLEKGETIPVQPLHEPEFPAKTK